MKPNLLLKRILFMGIFLVLTHLSSFAQNKTITGKVTSTGNAPVEGVSVTVKGSQSGVVTKNDGSFSIPVPPGSVVLVFSSVGYVTQEVPVGDRDVVNTSLEESSEKLTDIVVVGYGTQKKREVTSAVTSVNSEQFNKGNISDVAQLLQGKVAGLSIARAGGNPNGGFAIRLRGLSTLGANTQPLVVLDGQIGADLNSVDPNDIKSIDVLKDGSAAAIYGTRGSAGVIIITTKTGTKGASHVAYNGSVTAESAARLTPHLTAAEFRALGKGTDYKANTDWFEEITRTAISHIHNLSFSGGTGGTSYNASVNFRNSEGVAITTGFNQLNARLNLQQKALNDKLSININFATTRRKASLGFDDAFKYAAIYNPTAPIYSNDPLYNLTGGGFYEANFVDYSNPVAVLLQNTNEREIKRLNIAGSAEYEFFKGLKFLIRYAQQTSSTYNQAYLPRTAFISRNFLGVTGFGRGGFSFKEDQESFNQLYENILSYSTSIRDLDISALAGYSYQDFLFQGFSARAGNFITDASGQNFGTALDFRNGIGQAGSYKNGYKLVAFFGRINLNYNNIAFLSASLRREGSTQFGENNKWGMFPAVSAGVDISRLVDLPDISNLKLRASYGVTGSLPPSSYLSLQTVNTGGTPFYNGNTTSYITTSNLDKNANPDLKWEKKGELDIGLDFALFNNRLTGTLDYYERTTSDLMFNVVVPSPPALSPNTWLNIGTLKSSGFEVAVAYDVLKDGELNWNTAVNFSTYNVKLSKLDPKLAGSYVGATNLGTPGQEATQITRAVEGEPIGLLWGWVYTGIDANGKYVLQDLNKDSKIDALDQTKIGNGLPDFDLGWANTFKYKNWDLNFFLRGTFGHDLINTYRAFYENPNVATSYNVVSSKYFNKSITDGQIFSSLFVEKASFVKLDNATIGYNFQPKGKLAMFRNIRAYITGQNLFTITDYTGVDPEVRYADGTNVLAPGVDRRETWVLTRAFTIGLNLGF